MFTVWFFFFFCSAHSVLNPSLFKFEFKYVTQRQRLPDDYYQKPLIGVPGVKEFNCRRVASKEGHK